MLCEADTVVLAIDLPQYQLESGYVGTIVLIHEQGGYEVEFITLDGETVAVASLAADKVRPIAHREIAHVRSIDDAAR
jgi:hypothetical protein